MPDEAGPKSIADVPRRGQGRCKNPRRCAALEIQPFRSGNFGVERPRPGRRCGMKLVELARTVRSKNAGPLKLTLDLLFDDEAGYRRALQSPALEPNAVARLYGRSEGTVEVLPYPAALAIKIVMDRLVVSGDVGDRDVYGAQQHAPLLDLEL
jgi:uncharacterized protein DUF4387